MERERHYWLHRIDKTQIPYFRQELNQGRLRQGWGYQTGQDLRKKEINDGAFGNIGIYERIKKGDILLIPRLPDWGKVTIAEATEDFDTGYKFEIGHENSWGTPDYGHIFPAKPLTSFVRGAALVSGDLKRTLRYPRRFKSIYYDGCAKEIEGLIQAPESENNKYQDAKDRVSDLIQGAFVKAFDNTCFENELWDEFNRQFNATDWEFALLHGLRSLFPQYTIERTGGRSEKKHGTDILMLLPGILPDYQYAIAIQVKDYDWIVSDGVIAQISKAEHWNTKDGIKLIDKIVIITKAKEDKNRHLIEAETNRADREIKFIFSQELGSLLNHIAKNHLGLKEAID